jgi:hypothetical protein
MHGRVMVSVLLVAGAWIGLGWSPTVTAAPKGGSVTVANMRIDPDPAFHIRPDEWTIDAAGVPIDRRYLDYRTPGGDACVQGEIYTTGLTSLVLNRRMADGSQCAANGLPPRGFRIRFESLDACLLLTGTASGVCEHLTPAGSPHVRGETVFKSKGVSTAMTFYFITQDASGARLAQYRLTTDANAPITGSTSTRTATYVGGTATLAQHHGNPGGYVPMVYDIPMSFRITFDRVTVP